MTCGVRWTKGRREVAPGMMEVAEVAEETVETDEAEKAVSTDAAATERARAAAAAFANPFVGASASTATRNCDAPKTTVHDHCGKKLYAGWVAHLREAKTVAQGVAK
jgi:hypothetical protein